MTLGDRVLVGPHAHLSGCTIGARCFIATGAMIFNGAHVHETCTVALGANVHVDTNLAEGTFVPMGFIAYRRPARLYPPHEAPVVHDELGRLDFLHYVFGIEAGNKTRAEMMDEMMSRYLSA